MSRLATSVKRLWTILYAPDADAPVAPRLTGPLAPPCARAGGVLRVRRHHASCPASAHVRRDGPGRSIVFGLAAGLGLPPATRRSPSPVRREHLLPRAIYAHVLRLDAVARSHQCRAGGSRSPSRRGIQHAARWQLRGVGVGLLPARRGSDRLERRSVRCRPASTASIHFTTNTTHISNC